MSRATTEGVRSGATPAFRTAKAAYDRGDYERARGLAERTARGGASEAETYALLGSIDAALGNLDAAGAALVRAQRRSHADGGSAALDATIAAELAGVAAHAVDLELAKRVRVPFEANAWPPELRAEAYRYALARRTLALLEGDLAAAYFAARDAGAAAPDAAARITADSAGAAVSRMLGDFASERILLRRAWESVRSLSAEGADARGAAALAAFAIEAAAVMPVEARKAMTTFRSTLAKDPASARGSVEALGLMGASRVAEVSGDRGAAIGHAERALERWEALKVPLYVALTALELRRLTGDEGYVKTARAIASRAPKSWLAAELRKGRSPVARLTPAERVVLARLLRGDSAKAIGKSLGRSPYTISNHTRKIFAAFELNSRSKVIARCTELGITPEAVEREA